MTKLIYPTDSPRGKLKNIFFAATAILLWVRFIIWFLTSVLNVPFEYPLILADHTFTWNASTLFFGVIWAPLWEEAVFRYAPLTIAKALGDAFLKPIIVITLVLFAFGHGLGPWSILIQGIGSLALFWVYLKNGYSYWSSVAVHFLWNLSCYVLIPLFHQYIW